MGIEIGHYPDEDRLDLTVEGNLDLTLTGEILRVCSLIDRRVRVCVIDSTRILRVFDSGLGLMMLLLEKLKAFGVTLIMIGEIPGLPATVNQ
jgi:anti-anti-sigma regulatory factor